MLLKAREWHDLDAEERDDAIHSAQMWLRGDFPLLLPCDISDACRVRIIGEAGTAEQRRDSLINKRLFG